MDEENAFIKSKYSSGVNIILRLDTLWKDTHLHSRLGSFEQWNSDLDRIWLELARDLFEKKELNKESDNFNKVKEIFIGYDDELKKTGNFKDTAPRGFKKLSDDDVKNRSKQYDILMRKQLFLARLENYLGKGTTEDAGDESDWE